MQRLARAYLPLVLACVLSAVARGAPAERRAAPPLPPAAHARELPRHAQGAAPPRAADLDAYVARVMKTFEVPGLGARRSSRTAQTVVAKGYGVRRLGEPAPVDAQTLFGIASNTKVFTAAALGLLVEEGKIEWDAPVVDYLPWFRLSDPYVTRELTIRDLLVHRSGLGLGAGDLLWWPPSTYTRQEIARRLRYHPARDQLPQRLCVRQRAVSRRRRGDPGDERPVVGGLRQRAHPEEGRHDRSDRAVFGRARAGNVAAPHAPLDGKVKVAQAARQRQHESCRRHQLQRRGHGEVDERAARAGRLADGTRLFSERTYREHHHDRDADERAAGAAGAGGAAAELRRLRARAERQPTIAAGKC